MAIDLNRGVSMRSHPSGFRVAMYKEEPGVFYDMNGEPVSDELAAKAGFDVETLRLERQKQEKLAEARKRIEEEYKTAEQDVERALDQQVENYEVRHVGSGRYAVFDQNGNRLTEKPMSKSEAEDFVESVKVDVSAGESDAGSDAGGGSDGQA